MPHGFTNGYPVDVDPLLTADSDSLVPSQKAIKEYVDNSTPAQYWARTGAILKTTTANDSVAIGTTTTNYQLTVDSTSNTTPSITSWFRNISSDQTEVYFGAAEGAGQLLSLYHFPNGGDEYGGFRLWGDTTANGINIIPGGNIGIGNILPLAKLHVTGSQLLTGSLGVTGTRVVKGWFIDLEVTNMPTVGGVSIASALGWTRTGTDIAPTTSGDSVTMSGRLHLDKGADIAAAGDLTLGTDGNFFKITGNTTINAILVTGWQAGSEIILWFTGTPTVSHNTAGGGSTGKILLDGETNMSAVSGAVLKLIYDGTSFRETSRSFTGA